MDAAERGELDRLRCRAYGPAPDIEDDRAALQRLIELEELVVCEHVVPAGAVVSVVAGPDAAASVVAGQRVLEPAGRGTSSSGTAGARPTGSAPSAAAMALGARALAGSGLLAVPGTMAAPSVGPITGPITGPMAGPITGPISGPIARPDPDAVVEASRSAVSSRVAASIRRPRMHRPDAPASTAPPSSVGRLPAADSPPPPARAVRDDRRPIALLGGLMTVAVAATLAVAALVHTPGPDSPGQPDAAPLTPSSAYLESRAAYSFTRDPEAVTLLNIPLDGSFGNYIAMPSTAPVPDFPANGRLEWASHLGEYFGWEVWIGAAAGAGTGTFQREHCILIERGAYSRSRCVPAMLRPQNALLVSVPYALMHADERPVGMDPDERLGFWWGYDRAITVLLGADPSE